MKRLFILTLVLSAILCLTAFAEAPEIDAKYGIVYNLEADKPLFEKDVDSIIYPASLTKIMTGLLACEYYDERGGVDFEVTVSEAALENVEGNKIGLKAGETVSFYDLIVAVMVGSGNDAAYVIAETVGGSLDGFVAMMNERAATVGATHTTYSNPSGFHSSYMLTTLRDQALICAEASENNTLLKISSLVDYTMPETDLHKKREFTNQNLLFDKLSPGEYTLKIVATDASGKSKSSITFFTVKEIEVKPVETVVTLSQPEVASSIKMEINTYPKGNMPYGKPFTLRGRFTSDCAIVEARAYMLDANKNVIMEAKASSTTGRYNIKGYALDKGMKFNKLSPGAYYLKYYVKDANGDTAEWISDKFYIVK